MLVMSFSERGVEVWIAGLVAAKATAAAMTATHTTPTAPTSHRARGGHETRFTRTSWFDGAL
jgi:hypothetical protein